MMMDLKFCRPHQLVLDAFGGDIVYHDVEQDEYYALLLSRRTLQRCDDELAHRYGLFDPRSGDLFGIDEFELLARS